MAVYSDFPIENDKSHWLLNHAEGLVLRQSMIEFFTDARDDRGMQAAVQKRQEDVQALIGADFDTRYAGQDLGLTF
jgi:hypothetical protein